MKNLEKSNLSYSLGLLLSLSLVFIAFEWSSTEFNPRDLHTQLHQPYYEDDMIPLPIIEQKELNHSTPLPITPPLINIEVVDNFDPLEIDIPLDLSENTTKIDHPTFTSTPIEVEGENHPLIYAQQMPIFPGGDNALQQFLNKTIRYPNLAIEMNVSGRVYVSFIIEKDGSITSIKVVRGVDLLLNAESVRIMHLMPKWRPGKQNGKPVRVQLNLPINFVLQ